MEGLQLILLHMTDRMNAERSLAGCYHILTGKKSGQAIQDATLFGYQSWFGLFPKWERSSFEELVKHLILTGKLVPSGHSYLPSSLAKKEMSPMLERYQFTNRAFIVQNSNVQQHTIHIFWKRFQLLAQVISYHLSEKRYFNPIVTDIVIQKWVKQFWNSINHKDEFIHEIYQELFHYLSQSEDQLLSQLILDRLSGAAGSGKTFLQLSQYYQIPEAIIRIYFSQAIASLFSRISEGESSCLKSLIEVSDAKSIQLTQSAQKTYALLQKGLTVDEIINTRGLQRSTIEDHLVEMAIHVPDFNVSSFISENQLNQILEISSKLNTKKLRVIKQEIKGSEVSFFQIRIALIKGV
jgi:uncharacterized protein YpbB